MSSKPGRKKLAAIDPGFWTVINDLPQPLPTKATELDALERYFADVIDACLDPNKKANKDSPDNA